MNKIKAYPWIGVIIGGIIGLLVNIIISSYVSYFPYSCKDISMSWGEVFWLSAKIGLIVAWIAVIVATISVSKDIADVLEGVMWFFIWSILAPIIGGIIGLIIAAIAPIILGMVLGAVIVAIVVFACGDIDNEVVAFLIIWIPPITGGILFGIGWGLGSEFIANIIFVPMFGGIGYIVGKPIGKRADEKDKRTLEHERKMKEYKAKVDQWNREGYDVSELEEMLE